MPISPNAADYMDRKIIAARNVSPNVADYRDAQPTFGVSPNAADYADSRSMAGKPVQHVAQAPYQAPYQAPAQEAVPNVGQDSPAPPVGGRSWYNALDQGGRQAADDKWLGGDADYTDQLGEYKRALDEFTGRITNQKKNYEDDRGLAVGATEKNQLFSTNSLGEDFGARGMSYSGLFDKTKNELNTRFSDQTKNINLVAQRNSNDADNRLVDYAAENRIGTGNARRSALLRMTTGQSLLDSNAGLF